MGWQRTCNPSSKDRECSIHSGGTKIFYGRDKKMEDSAPQPKMSFAAAIRAALTKKTAAESADTQGSKKAARKIATGGPAAITARPQRRNTSRGG